MSLVEFIIILIAIALFIVAWLVKRGLIWAIPMTYCALAFYFGVIGEYHALYFAPIGLFTIICFVVFIVKMFQGDLI